MTRTLGTLQLPLNTACLAFLSGLEERWLAAGSYQLSASRQTRHGRLHIFDVAGSILEGLQVTEVCSESLPGEGAA